MEAILTKVAIVQRVEFPNYDMLELALHDDGSPPSESNRLPSPSGFADAQSDSGNNDDEDRIPTDEVEEPNLSARRIKSPPIEWLTVNEERQRSSTKGSTPGTSHQCRLPAQRF